MAKETEQKGKPPVFNVDPKGETGEYEVPSITKLLSRKKLEESSAYIKRPGFEENENTDQKEPEKQPNQSTSNQTGITVANTNHSMVLQPANDPRTNNTQLNQSIDTRGKSEATHLLTANTLTMPPSASPTPPSSPPIASTPAATSLKLSTEELSNSQKVNEVHKPIQHKSLLQPIAIRAEQRSASVKRLILWDAEILQHSSDPMGRAIVLLSKKGLKSALFMGIIAPSPSSPVPTFNSSATVNPLRKLNIWTGLRWNPSVTIEIWNHFVKNGVVELAPPGTTTNMYSQRNMIRAAFGIESDEWLTLVRVGPTHGCRGVLAFVSKQSIAINLADALPLIQAELPPTMAPSPAKKAA